MPVTGPVGDFGEQKDVNANVDEYFSAAGELVEQFGFVLGNPQTIATSAATIPASASNVEIGAVGVAVALTLPAASAVTPGHILLISDANGSVSSSATVSVQTPAGGGKIGAVAAATASTSAASYAFLNAAYTSLRLKSNGTNWNPW
jgi:hypothetical protein